MTAHIGDYVKATFDFISDEASDLSLSEGDVVRITDILDENWAYGEKIGLDYLSGNFPLAYVECVNIPCTHVGQKIFLALEDFLFEQNGDLQFKKGDIIVGLEGIDDMWWKGQNSSQTGIFPLSFVVELDVINVHQFRSDSKRFSKSNSDDFKSRTKSSTHVYEGHKINEVTYARALMDVKPQLDGELAFCQGDIIEITETVDSDWLYGQLGSKEGLVLAACVQLLNDGSQLKSNNYLNKDVLNKDRSSHGTLSTCTIQNSVESWKLEDSENVIVSSSSQFYTPINLHNAETAPHGRVNDNFISQNPSEISLKKNIIVFLIRHIDAEWTEGEIDGKRGIFPTKCVEIIVDCSNACSPDLNERESSTKPSTETCDSKHCDKEPDINTMATSCRFSGDSETDVMFMSRCSHEDIGDYKLKYIGSSSPVSSNPSESIHDQRLQLQAKNNGSRKCSSMATSTTKPALPLKPAISPRPFLPPPVAPKPFISTKPSSVIDCKFLQTLKSDVSSKQTSTEGTPAAREKSSTVITSKSLQTLTPTDSSNQTSTEKTTDAREKSSTVINSKSLQTLKSTDSSKQRSTGNIHTAGEKPSFVINSTSLPTLKQTDSSKQIFNEKTPTAGDNTLKISSVVQYFEDKIAKSITTGRIQSSSSSTKQQMEDSLNVSVQNDKTVNRNSRSDLAEGAISDININAGSVSFHHVTGAVPTRPAVPSPGVNTAEASSLINKGPVPQASSTVAAASSETVPAVKQVPTRQHPEGLSNKAEIMRRSRQSMTSYRAQSPPRLSVRPTSFPSAPRRPPPRPASYVLFSPRGRITEEDPNQLIVMNLREKLQAITNGIEKYEKTRADLEKSVVQDDSQETQTESKNTLDFLEKQLVVLQQEKSRLEENLLAANSEDAKLEKARLLAAQHAVDEEKRKEEEEIRKEEERKKREEMRAKRKIHREKVIEEIINTERDYLMSLQLCLETFYDGQDPPSGIDLDFLLGNMEEIADVSQKVLIHLEACVAGKSVEEQCIGQCFIQFAEDMKNTYAPYCRNHDEVTTALEQYGDSTSINSYLNSKIDRMKQQTNVFDMSSILIRPVQRILKYPLLLNELLKNTEEDHPDREDIETAIKEMTDVARAINEYKRRKDLVYKYKKSTDETFSDKISKLSLHSIKKKSTRMKGRLSTNFGIALQMKDEMFDKEVTKFQNLEKAVKVFLDSVQQYFEYSQEAMRCQTVYVDDIMDFYKGRECAEAAKLFDVTCKQLSLYDSMKETVDNVISVPLNILVGLFSAPTKVIEKRYDKLLDYNYQLGKMENDKELQTAKNDYEAMNAQLLDELPKLYNLAFRTLRHCISAFVLARRDFMDQSLKETCSLLELPSIASKANLMEVFKIRHTTAFDHISMLSFIPKGFNPRVDTVKADRATQKGRPSTDSSFKQQNSLQTSLGSQNDAQRRYLHQLYPPDKLHTVATTYNATDLMDISLTEGTLVGVVKQLDPMGNTERWFVDDGGSKGFIPCSILRPLEYSPPGSITNADEDDDIISILSGDSSDMVFTGNDDRVDCHTNNSFTDSYAQKSESPQYQYYYALYDFKSRHPNETSLTAGHPVTVLAFHDLDGNSEWWLVNSEGKHGYVPANYLAPVPYS